MHLVTSTIFPEPSSSSSPLCSLSIISVVIDCLRDENKMDSASENMVVAIFLVPLIFIKPDMKARMLPVKIKNNIEAASYF